MTGIKTPLRKRLVEGAKRRQKMVDKNIGIQKKYLIGNEKYKEIYDEHVGGYTDEFNYKEINKYMYGGNVEFDSDPYIIPDINGIFKVFEEIPRLSDKITTFRLTDYKINRKTLSNNKQLFIPAFTSTSYKVGVLKDVRSGQSVIDILLPKGSKGLIASESTYYDTEKEILLPPGYYELVNESVKDLHGKKINYYKIKLKKQILSLNEWLEHLKLNNRKIEEMDYFLEILEELNMTKKPSKRKRQVVKLKKERKIPTPKKKKITMKKKKITMKKRKPIKIVRKKL